MKRNGDEFLGSPRIKTTTDNKKRKGNIQIEPSQPSQVGIEGTKRQAKSSVVVVVFVVMTQRYQLAIRNVLLPSDAKKEDPNFGAKDTHGGKKKKIW